MYITGKVPKRALGADHENPLHKKLGKSTIGKGCQCIKKLADVDKRDLQELINQAYP